MCKAFVFKHEWFLLKTCPHSATIFYGKKRSEGMNFQLQTRSRWIITLPFLPNGDVHDAPNSAHAEIKPPGAKSTEVDHSDMKVKEATFRANAKLTTVEPL